MATRLGPLAATMPKSLVDIAGRPFAEYQLELLSQHELRDVVYCVGHLGSAIERAVGDGQRLGMRVQYAYDGETLLGTGGAIRNALPLLGDAFLVLYGDSYLECNYQAVIEAFFRSGKRGLMTVIHNDDRWDRSNVRFSDGVITAYDKQRQDSSFRHIDYGLGVLSAAAFEPYPAGSSFDLVDVYGALLSQQQLAAFEVHDRFYEIGSLSGIDELRRRLAGDEH